MWFGVVLYLCDGWCDFGSSFGFGFFEFEF